MRGVVDFTLSTRVSVRVALPRRVRRSLRRMQVPRTVRAAAAPAPQMMLPIIGTYFITRSSRQNW